MQTTSNKFKQVVDSPVIPKDWNVSIAFDKTLDDNAGWFTLDDSLLNGSDILMPSDDNPLQEWFKYPYESVKDRVISIEWERGIEFPYSVQSAMADITLKNTDRYFTPGSSSPVEEYILPKRPIQIFSGFANAEVLGQFVGLTQGMPEVTNTEAKFHALDFMSELFDQPLSKTIAMRDVTTDVVLAAIFDAQGLVPSQYQLASGRNRIPFLFFDRGVTTGEVLRQLMQAEGGLLWLDEQGIYRFTPRVVADEEVVHILDDKNIIEASVTHGNNIINHVKIRSNVREVQPYQSIHKKESSGTSTSSLNIIQANSSRTISFDLTDPAISAVEPTQGHASGVSWFIAKNAAGDVVPSGVTATGELFTNSYDVTFTNSNLFDVDIDEIDIWGEPALLVDPEGMRYELEKTDSIEKYGRNTLEINNDFFGTADNANSFALSILHSYAEHLSELKVSLKPNPALQLGDVVSLDYKEYTGTYKIKKITNVIAPNGVMTQELILIEYRLFNWFILSGAEDRSLLDGGDILTP